MYVLNFELSILSRLLYFFVNENHSHLPLFLALLPWFNPNVLPANIDTTAAYSRINNPLRDEKRMDERQPHPLPATVQFIAEGIMKLRAVVAKDVKSKRLAGKKVPKTTLWRGMRGVHATKEFREHGGTELAPMSTTADFKVAVK